MYQMGQAEIDAVAKVINHGQLFRYRGGEGGWCDQFEAALSKKTGVRYSLLTSSGTGALICGLVGLGIGPGDEVIVPAYTFMASALAVTAAGGIPVIADVDESLMLDPGDVERKITKYTKAIMPVHMCGRVCNLSVLGKIAAKHHIKIIEDACQAVGGSYRGKRLGSIGDAGAFSFNHFKIISCGEGGAVMTSDMKTYDRGLIFHDGGCVFRKYAAQLKTPFFAGMNFRASEILGAIMFIQLKRLDGILATLRARQSAMLEILEHSTRFRVSPSNEVKGDCGCVVSLLFESDDEAKAFVKEIGEKKLSWGYRPIDSGKHVYINWEPIMKQHGSHNPRLNPYSMARRKIAYSPDMCRRSLDIMSRSVLVSVPFSSTVAGARAMARKMV